MKSVIKNRRFDESTLYGYNLMHMIPFRSNRRYARYRNERRTQDQYQSWISKTGMADIGLLRRSYISRVVIGEAAEQW